MSDSIDDGGPAFPIVGGGGDSRLYEDYGMSLRDWFAGQALSGWIASFNDEQSPIPHASASLAYELADAMIAARKVKP